MEKFEGLKIIEDNTTKGVRTLEFVVSEQRKLKAIETLIGFIDLGWEVTLTDNRDMRQGVVSIKIENGTYLKCGGGHGFSSNWQAVSKKDVWWVMKAIAPYNFGKRGGDNGSIKIYS